MYDKVDSLQIKPHLVPVALVFSTPRWYNYTPGLETPELDQYNRIRVASRMLLFTRLEAALSTKSQNGSLQCEQHLQLDRRP